MEELIVRKAEPADAPAMALIEAESFEDPWSEEALQKELTENRVAFYLVGELDGEVVGYAGLWWLDDEGHITNVAVREDCRGRGVGKAILDVLISFTGEEGITDYTLEVREDNERALLFYESLGFSQEGRRPNYYGNKDAIIMWRRKDD